MKVPRSSEADAAVAQGGDVVRQEALSCSARTSPRRAHAHSENVQNGGRGIEIGEASGRFGKSFMLGYADRHHDDLVRRSVLAKRLVKRRQPRGWSVDQDTASMFWCRHRAGARRKRLGLVGRRSRSGRESRGEEIVETKVSLVAHPQLLRSSAVRDEEESLELGCDQLCNPH